MIRDPLSAVGFKPSFSGHETFPLRQLWLRKAYVAVSNHSRDTGHPAPRALFSDEDSISRFGAGKNMVYSMRHWALACGVISESEVGYETTPLGDFIFDANTGKDPYQERLATAWLIQWFLASTPDNSTTWYWAFNRFNLAQFTRGDLEKSVLGLIEARGYKRLTAETVKRDIQCFIRSYSSTKASRDDDFRSDSVDDLAEPVLSELGLISSVEDGKFLFRRGQKIGLPDAVFTYALNCFWERYSPGASTLSFDAIAYEPGSPALVFKLDEGALAGRLIAIEESSRGRFAWSDTAGLRQVVRVKRSQHDAFELLKPAYVSRGMA